MTQSEASKERTTQQAVQVCWVRREERRHPGRAHGSRSRRALHSPLGLDFNRVGQRVPRFRRELDSNPLR